MKMNLLKRIDKATIGTVLLGILLLVNVFLSFYFEYQSRGLGGYRMNQLSIKYMLIANILLLLSLIISFWLIIVVKKQHGKVHLLSVFLLSINMALMGRLYFPNEFLEPLRYFLIPLLGFFVVFMIFIFLSNLIQRKKALAYTGFILVPILSYLLMYRYTSFYKVIGGAGGMINIIATFFIIPLFAGLFCFIEKGSKKYFLHIGILTIPLFALLDKTHGILTALINKGVVGKIIDIERHFGAVIEQKYCPLTYTVDGPTFLNYIIVLILLVLGILFFGLIKTKKTRITFVVATLVLGIFYGLLWGPFLKQTMMNTYYADGAGCGFLPDVRDI